MEIRVRVGQRLSLAFFIGPCAVIRPSLSVGGSCPSSECFDKIGWWLEVTSVMVWNVVIIQSSECLLSSVVCVIYSPQ